MQTSRTSESAKHVLEAKRASQTAALDGFFGNNRWERRKARSLARKRVRVLRRMCRTRADFDALLKFVAENDQPTVEARLRRMAYAAYHTERIAQSEAQLFDCNFSKG